MRIQAVRTRILRAETGDRVEMAFGRMAARATALVEIEADGLVGVGESWINFPPWAADERRATIEQGVAPLLIGRDARRIGELHALLVDALWPLARQWGAPGPVMQAISGADLALWDLAGKAAGVPVAELLGGRVRERVPVYASGLGPDGVGELAARCARDGLPSVKVKVGFGAERDAANVRAARAAVGAGGIVRVDANRAWTMDAALELAPVLRECDVAWVEEPLADDAPERLAAFSRRSRLPVATGENLYGHVPSHARTSRSRRGRAESRRSSPARTAGRDARSRHGSRRPPVPCRRRTRR
jgi:L-alanine-DL-glutamate epimerase-like enolase superfamily enzyme